MTVALIVFVAAVVVVFALAVLIVRRPWHRWRVRLEVDRNGHDHDPPTDP